MSNKLVRYALGALICAGVLWLVSRPAPSTTGDGLVVRISHFRPSIPATMQKARGSLEKRLATTGATVDWTEFKVTPDSILAASSGSVDIMVGGLEGALSSIALGIPAKIVATGPHDAPKTGWFTAILVPESSPLRTLADLKGKKIAVGRGGFAEAVLAVAVRQGGGRYPEDVEPVYLSTSDATNAFTSGLVDAVLSLDPYVAHILRSFPSRILTDNERLGYPTIWSVLVQDAFAEKHPDVVKLVVEEFLAVGPWIAQERAQAAGSLAQVVGFDPSIWETTLGRASYLLETPADHTLRDIQYVADRILDLGVIRTKLDVRRHVRQLPGQLALSH